MTTSLPGIKRYAVVSLVIASGLQVSFAAEMPTPGSIQTVLQLNCEQLIAPGNDKIIKAMRSKADTGSDQEPKTISEALQKESFYAAAARSAEATAKANKLQTLSTTRLKLKELLETEKTKLVPEELEKFVPEKVPATTSIEEAPEKSLNAVKTLAEQISGLREAWSAIQKNGDYSNLPEAVVARQKLADCAGRVYVEAKKAAAIAEATAPDSAAARVAALKLKEAAADSTYLAQRAIFDQPQLSLFLGPSFTIDGNDKFKTGVEISALYDGGAGSFSNYARIITEFSYKTQGVVDTTRKPGDAATPVDPNDVIRSAPGLIRFSTGFSTDVTDRYSLAFTGGLSSIPGGGGNFSKPLRPHGQVGLLGRTFINESLYSRLTLGYAFDRYWINKTLINADDASAGTNTQKSYNRVVVEGLVLTTDATAPGGISAAGRLTLNTPINGKGPSEIRLSILATMNFLEFFTKLNPKP